MLGVFGATVTPMLVLFSCIVIGFILNKKDLVPKDCAVVLSKLENYILVPALIINTFSKYCTIQSVKEQYKLVLYSMIILAIALIISLRLAKYFTKDKYKINIYKYALAFGNFSFMGNAIVPGILGEEFLYEYMLFILPLNVAVYTWGTIILIPKGNKKRSPLKSLVNPIFISIVVGAFLGLTNAKDYLPAFVSSTVSNLAACMGPLAMVLTGFVIGHYNVNVLLKNKKVYIATALRLIVFPLLFVAILYLLNADKTTIMLAFIAYGTPLGLNTVVFPAAYGGETYTGASMATISHTLCVISIPVFYTILTMILA